MSAVLGLINFDKKPVDRIVLEEMMTPMDYWGPDGKGIWNGGYVGLGHLLRYNTPESIYESLPSTCYYNDLIITSHARIDNREDLLRIFEIPIQNHSLTPDSKLILNAYRKWGEDCTDHLLGDWVFAIWDKNNQKLFIARDHHGATGLYYYKNTHFFAFSSCIKGLLTLESIPHCLNELQIAQSLVSWNEHGAITVYKDIFRLPPAHKISITNGTFKIKQYWYLEETPSIYLKSDAEYVENFMEIYTKAVRCRFRSHGNVGGNLSGGLDSGSIAAIAAKEMEKSGKRYQTFSSVTMDDVNPFIPKNRSDDASFLLSTAQHVGNIDLNLVKSENITPLQSIKKGLEIHSEPFHAVNNQYWMQSIWEEARKQGITTMLSGDGGNFTISWHNYGYFALLAKNLHFITLAREISSWRKIHPMSLMKIIKNHIISPMMPLNIKNLLSPSSKNNSLWEHYSPINIEFAKRLHLSERMEQAGHDPQFNISGDNRKNRIKGIKPGKSMLGCRQQQSGAAFKLELRDPTMDRRLLEYCFNIPDNMFMRNGIDRYLIRIAMKGRLPEKVLMNNKRGLQALDILTRLNKNSSEIRDTLLYLQKEHPIFSEYVNIQKVFGALDSIENEIHKNIPRNKGSILLRGLMIGLFLQNYKLKTNCIKQ